MCSAESKRPLPVLTAFLYILKPQKVILGAVLAFSIVLSVLNMSIPYLLKVVIDTVASGSDSGMLFYIGGVLLGVYLARNGLYYLAKGEVVLLGERVAFNLRNQMIEHLHRVSVAYYKRQQPAKISARLIQDVGSIQQFISSELTKLLINALMLCVGAAMLIQLNLPLAAIALAFLPLNLLTFRLFSGSITASARIAKEHVSSISGDLVEQFSGVEAVKSAVSETKEQEKFARSMRHSMSAQIHEKRLYLFQKMAADMVAGLAYVAFFTIGGHMAMKGNMTPGTFAAFFLYMRRIYPLAIALVADAGKFSSTAASVERVYEILRTTPQVQPRTEARARKIERGRIEFRDVAFGYGDTTVLKDVNFVVEPGEHVLITGPSGCGKTTLLNLIPRLYDCTSGTILIDGVDHTEFTLPSLRQQIGLVFQDCFLFNSSVLENIRYASPEATDEQVVTAARQALAHDFINEMPRRYLTPIGEGGIQLSLGQRQRIGIARAILKQPRIFILDDALASLDIESSVKLAEQLRRVAQGRTMLIVTHNPSLFAHVRKEMKFENGTLHTYGWQEIERSE